MKARPTIERLREVLVCVPETGTLTWKITRGKATQGKPAGGLHVALGYMTVTVDQVTMYAHRVVWAMTYGKWPDAVIDHRNGVRSDNRVENLRNTTAQVNAQNRSKAGSHNKTGVLGVSHSVTKGRFKSSIKVPGGKERYLGTFATSDEAHAAYITAKNELHEGVGAQMRALA